MAGDASMLAGITRQDRAELIRFLRKLRWCAVPRIAFWGMLSLTIALFSLPRAVQGMLPLYVDTLVAYGFLMLTVCTGLAAAIGAACEHFGLRGYRAGSIEAPWNRLAGSARFWLRATLLCAAMLIALVYASLPDVHRGPTARTVFRLMAMVGALVVVFSLWQRRLAQLCEGVARALGANSLADSAASVARSWRIVAIGSAVVAVFTILGTDPPSRSQPPASLTGPMWFLLFAFLLYALIQLQRTLGATADRLARDEDE